MGGSHTLHGTQLLMDLEIHQQFAVASYSVCITPTPKYNIFTVYI